MRGALTPIVTYFVGRRGLGRAEAIIAGFALALYGPLVFTDGQLEKEGLGALMVALALLATTHAIAPGRRPVDGGAGGKRLGRGDTAPSKRPSGGADRRRVVADLSEAAVIEAIDWRDQLSCWLRRGNRTGHTGQCGGLPPA